MKKIISSLVLIMLFFIILVTPNNSVNAEDTITLNVFNWGEYIDEEVITEFETAFPNVNVNYETFDSNESMYTKLTTGDAKYDVVIPSDYMIEKLIKEDLLVELDPDKMPNRNEISDEYYEKSKVFDPNNKYTIPYFWGTVGILYDTTKVNKPVDSWSILWDEDYKKDIFMYDSQRDSLMVALKLLGKSMNTTNKDDLEEAKNKLIEQKPLVYSYVTDSVIQQMISGEAALAVVYSGDASFIMSENENMAYAIPKEGTNFWIDSMVIPKTSQHVDLAHEFINFMCKPEIATKNTEYVMYSSPVESVFNTVKTEDWASNIAYNPEGIIDILGGDVQTEVFRDPGDFINEYDKVWSEVLAPKTNYIIPLIIGIVVIVGVGGYFLYSRKKKSY
ncbi:ABC transporter substrate-binding protein [Mycoplasmatota bacterium]|nr:ABC transporter substrate-binding protein [Mycoplasmatota bacterium]